jgi:hypothetical protein
MRPPYRHSNTKDSAELAAEPLTKVEGGLGVDLEGAVVACRGQGRQAGNTGSFVVEVASAAMAHTLTRQATKPVRRCSVLLSVVVESCCSTAAAGFTPNRDQDDLDLC